MALVRIYSLSLYLNWLYIPSTFLLTFPHTKLKANYLPPLVLMSTSISISPIYLRGVVLRNKDKFTTYCSETGNMSPLTHRPYQPEPWCPIISSSSAYPLPQTSLKVSSMQASYHLKIFLDTHVGVYLPSTTLSIPISNFCKESGFIYSLYLSVAPIHNN